MSQNYSAYNGSGLMGFSVQQPSIGAQLQFYPAMGSKELDALIDSYVPGEMSILDKRAQVTIEFFQHSMNTGESFKFYLVHSDYSAPSTTQSPASTLMDSGYGSSFNVSPVMSEGQSSTKAKSQASSSKAASPDFSHLPGMKILTKEGVDVTNSASRGCKTKEQRDHAHMMRIMKACDACRRKKVRCDPTHKRSVPGQSEAKVTKKTKRAPAARPSAASTPVFNPSPPVTTSSFDSFTPESLDFNADLNFDMDMNVDMGKWDEFVQYDEPVFATQYNNFFLDPTQFSLPQPLSSGGSNMSSPQQYTAATNQPAAQTSSLTGTDCSFIGEPGGTFDFGDPAPTLPYLQPDGVARASNDYVDFNLYSPGSSAVSDDDMVEMEKMVSKPKSRRAGSNRILSSRRHDVAGDEMLEDFVAHEAYAQPAAGGISHSHVDSSLDASSSPVNSSRTRGNAMGALQQTGTFLASPTESLVPTAEPHQPPRPTPAAPELPHDDRRPQDQRQPSRDGAIDRRPVDDSRSDRDHARDHQQPSLDISAVNHGSNGSRSKPDHVQDPAQSLLGAIAADGRQESLRFDQERVQTQRGSLQQRPATSCRADLSQPDQDHAQDQRQSVQASTGNMDSQEAGVQSIRSSPRESRERMRTEPEMHAETHAMRNDPDTATLARHAGLLYWANEDDAIRSGSQRSTGRSASSRGLKSTLESSSSQSSSVSTVPTSVPTDTNICGRSVNANTDAKADGRDTNANTNAKSIGRSVNAKTDAKTIGKNADIVARTQDKSSSLVDSTIAISLGIIALSSLAYLSGTLNSRLIIPSPAVVTVDSAKTILVIAVLVSMAIQGKPRQQESQLKPRLQISTVQQHSSTPQSWSLFESTKTAMTASATTLECQVRGGIAAIKKNFFGRIHGTASCHPKAALLQGPNQRASITRRQRGMVPV